MHPHTECLQSIAEMLIDVKRVGTLTLIETSILATIQETLAKVVR